MQQTILQDGLAPFLESRETPCLSLYQPTHRRRPENQQDVLRYKKLLATLEDSLLRQYSSKETGALLEPFHALAGDQGFWTRNWDGLGVLGTPGLFQVFKFQHPVVEFAVAAPSFHIKPLVRNFQSDERYQVLALTRHDVRLYEGSRDRIEEAILAPGVPRTSVEAIGDQHEEATQTAHSGARGQSSIRAGIGSKKDEIGIDEERYFRAVDRAILEHHSRPSGLPLILASLTQHHSLFHGLSHNPFLVADGIEADPGALSPDQFRERAWEIMEPVFRERLATLIAKFEEGRAKKLGTDVMEKAAFAAVESRIGSLLVEAERHIPGSIDEATGRVRFSSLDDPRTDDLLDDLAELVLRRGGQVIVVPAAEMPTNTGLAAIYRF